MVSTELRTPALDAATGRPEGRSGTGPSSLAPALLSLLALVSALGWGLGAATGLAQLQAPSAAWLIVLGVGSAPWVSVRGLGSMERWALSALVGLSVLAIAPTVAVTVRLWHPLPLLVLVAVPALVAHVRVLATGGLALLLEPLRGDRPRRHRPDGAVAAGRSWSRLLAPGLAVVGAVACVGAALVHRGVQPQYFGYLREVGPLWFFGLALVLAAVVALRGSSHRSGWIVATALTAVTTLTPALVYDLPRSASTSKHVGLVEQVLSQGHLSSSVAVYNAWPGFFAAAAWLCGLGGIHDPFQLAQWWAPALGLVRVLALGQLLRTAGVSPRWTWSAVVVAVLADSLGADYFSPQALAFVLALLVFGVLLRPEHSGSWRRDVLILAGCATAVSHQLTPYVIAGVAVVLVLGRVVRLTDALCVVVPPLLWTGLHLGSLHGFVSLSDIGSFANFRPPRTVAASGLERSPVVACSVRALLVGVAVIGILGLRGLATRPWARRWLAVAAAPAVGLGLVAVNPYGNEGIFRATLFGLPWLGLLAARGLASARRPLLWLVPALAVLAPSFLVATSALDPVYVIRSGDLHAFRAVAAAARAEPGRDVVVLDLGDGDLPGDLPTTTGGAVPLTRSDIGDPVTQSDRTPADQVDQLTTALRTHLGAGADTDVYAVWSPLSATYDAAYALQTRDQFAALRDALASSASWEVVSREDGTVLYRLRAGVLSGTAS